MFKQFLNVVQNYFEAAKPMDNESSTRAHRGELRDALLAAATETIAERGHQALRARDLASQVGCSVGSIYNVFPDIDALILAVKGQTLDRLEREVQLRLGPFPGGTPRDASDRFLALAKIYIEFAHENWRLWSSAFEHTSPDSPALDDYMKRLDIILANIEAPLGALLPEIDATQRRLLARGLFGSVNGVVTLGLDQKLGAISLEELGWQVETVLSATLRGLIGAAAFPKP
jgi:AcrR family transcriptional regulator